MAAVVGAAGGAAMEAVDIIKAIKWHRQMPWNVQSDTIDPPKHRADVRPGEEHLPVPGWKAYWFAGALRLFVSGALPGVVAATHLSAEHESTGGVSHRTGSAVGCPTGHHSGAVDGQERGTGCSGWCSGGGAATSADPPT